jgi:hypothetical protein
MIHILSALLISACLLTTLGGCSTQGEQTDDTTTNDNTFADTTVDTSADTTVDTSADTYVIGNKTLSFVSEDEKAGWRDPLVALLTKIQETDEEISFVIRGYSVSLMDVTHDGVPEVLVNYGGGSMLNATVEVYDLYSGEAIGWLEIGRNMTVQYYYHAETDDCRLVTTFAWRAGGDNYSYHTQRITYDEESRELAAKTICGAEYYRDMRLPTEDAEGEDATSPDEWQLYACWVDGETATLGEYMGAVSEFADGYVLIPDTRLQEISWSDLDGYGTERDLPSPMAMQMTDALLGTEQKHIAFD